MSPCRRLEGKRAFVTAAAQGIGRAIALRFATEGAHVTAVDIDANKLSTLSDEGIETAGVDVTDSEALAQVLRNGHYDVVVNCVGWVHHGTILECEPAEWRRTFQLNVDSVYEIARLVLPSMIAARRGSIVNIASLAGQRGAANRAAYSASKAAVIGMTKSFGKDLATTGVLVNCVAPAVIATPMLDQMSQEHIDYMVSKIPMNRLGQPVEVAELVAFLASERMTFSTGATFDISGGRAVF